MINMWENTFGDKFRLMIPTWGKREICARPVQTGVRTGLGRMTKTPPDSALSG
jgi:hypothetical protein